MNFYKRHLGDYAKDAGHLTMLEHGAYGLLLDRYYTTEQPITSLAEAYRICRARSRDEKAAVDAVLREFFIPVGDSFMNRRAEEEIAKAAHQRDVNRETGKRGGRPKQTESGGRTETESVTEQETESEPNRNPSQTPDSISPPIGGDSGSAQRAAPPAPPPFDGKNAQALNGKAVVPLDAAWELPGEWGEDAERLGFKPGDVFREAERFRQYWVKGKGSGTRRSVKGWRQSWSNWLGKAAERAQR